MSECDRSTYRNQDHYIYRNNPLELKCYIDKRVEVKTHDGISRQGYVHTVDPVTGSYVLYDTNNDDQLTLEIVVGNAVEAVSVLTEMDGSKLASCASKLHRLLHRQSTVVGEKSPTSFVDMEACKRTVAAWLRRHLVPVADSADDASALTIMGALTITSPYTPENCFSENEIILGKVQGILKSMPEQWNENDFSQ